MRAVLIILAFFIPGLSAAQESNSASLSLDEAIQIALKGNPGITNDSIRKQIVSEIKSTWNKWLYNIHKTLTLQEYHSALSDLGRIAGLRYQSGDIDLYESSTLKNKLADLVTNLAISQNETRKYGNSIRRLTYSDHGIHPSDSSFYMYEIDKYPAQYELSTEDSSMSEYGKFVHELNVENRQLELDNLFFRLQYHRSFGMDYSMIIISTATAKFRSEEIDYLEYADFISEAFKMKFDYLSVLNDYNECAIQLEYHAYQKP